LFLGAFYAKIAGIAKILLIKNAIINSMLSAKKFLNTTSKGVTCVQSWDKIFLKNQ